MGYSNSNDSPYNVQPFSKWSTLNTTAYIPASRSAVWPVLRAMNEWSTFQDVFDISFVGGNGVVELGQEIKIESAFPTTVEEYDEIVEEERICWTLNGFEILGISIPSPYYVLRTARCIELFDIGNDVTLLHNWISYAGLGWPVVVSATGYLTKKFFDDFNAELAVEFN